MYGWMDVCCMDGCVCVCNVCVMDKQRWIRTKPFVLLAPSPLPYVPLPTVDHLSFIMVPHCYVTACAKQDATVACGAGRTNHKAHVIR